VTADCGVRATASTTNESPATIIFIPISAYDHIPMPKMIGDIPQKTAIALRNESKMYSPQTPGGCVPESGIIILK
jgi:hypothetical protein